MAGILQGVLASIGAAPAVYIEDAFSTWLYTGNGSSQTITNGIEITGEGALVWIKDRSGANSHVLVDTARGATNFLRSNSTNAQTTDAARVSAFTASGFSVGNDTETNGSGSNYCSWTFEKMPKFFDVVTFTSTEIANQRVSHNLGSVPGMIFVKKTSGAGSWFVYHRSEGRGKYLALQSTIASQTQANFWGTSDPTSTDFGLDSSNVAAAGDSLVAYLFAHNAGGFGAAGTDNVISCGSYTTNGSGFAEVNLGYEPQYLMIKSASTNDTGWEIYDVMRGWSTVGEGTRNPLRANLSSAESAAGQTPNYIIPTATGFIYNISAYTGVNFIYMAIRRPMKPPTSGIQVFSPVAQSTSTTLVTTNFVVDASFMAERNNGASGLNTSITDRLRGGDAVLITSTNASEYSSGGNSFDSNTSFNQGWLSGGFNGIFWNFRRASTFFDVVCTSVFEDGTPVTHNLGVTPELILVKTRSSASNWMGAVNDAGNIRNLSINTTSGGYLPSLTYSSYFNATTINPAGIYNGGGGSSKGTVLPVVIYLFATVAGVSKVGSYTGTGGTQTINAGLPTGARFVLIKRTDSTGNWWVWDTARGMVTSTDPRLAFNSTAAELNNDWVLTTTNGFQIVTTDATVNASGGSYIYLAIA